ncbi:MAG: SpoIIE family protein phosphatase [Bacteroidia bacterium]|nr:SpoIIE family protein phosphatase [Bacteroidia bacterium]
MRSIVNLIALIIFGLIPNLHSQQTYLDSINRIAGKTIDDSLKVKANNSLGKYYKSKNVDSSIIYYNLALKIAAKINYKRGYYNALNGLSWDYHLKQDFYISDSITNLILNDVKVPPGNLYDCYHNLSYYRTGQNRFSEALKYQIASEQLVIKHKNYNLLVSVYNQFGNLYNAWALKSNDSKIKYQKSLNYYLAADSIAIKFNLNEIRQNVILMNLALGYENNNQFDKAEYFYHDAFNFLKNSPNQTGYALALTNYCSFKLSKYKYNLNKQELADCIAYSVIAEERSRKSGYLSLISYIKYSKAEAFRLTAQYDKAINEAEFLINPKENSILTLTCEAYNTLYEIFRSKGETERAINSLKLHYTIKDSLDKLKNNEELTNLEARYNSDQKRKENDLLKANNLIAQQTISEQKKVNLFISCGLMLALAFGISIYRGYTSKQKSNKELALKNIQIEEQKKGILDSIHYAKRIQSTLLASTNLLNENLNDYFVWYKPKDIVSGDFYWATLLNDGRFILIGADSTGHGVPGAFMSLLNITFLNEAINERKISDPGEILCYVRSKLIKSLSEDGSEDGGKDGMDCTLCCFDFKTNSLDYATANNSFYLIRNEKLIVSGVDKMPVGKSPKDTVDFKTKHLTIEKGDIIYIFTDGFADQFGGPKGKKYKYKQFEEKLLKINQYDLKIQKQILESEFEQWKGNLEQVDDVLIFGIKI